MSSQFTGWRFLVNFLLPPPLLLTFLLVLPFPRNIRKALLLFTSRVMTFAVGAHASSCLPVQPPPDGVCQTPDSHRHSSDLGPAVCLQLAA
jgi:hypothetical protein